MKEGKKERMGKVLRYSVRTMVVKDQRIQKQRLSDVEIARSAASELSVQKAPTAST